MVALLYALEPARQRFFSRNAILYTPYSSALMQPELVEAGRNYLLEKISSAQQELKHIGSQAFPGRSLASSPAFTPEDYLTVIVTEQMDPGRFYSIVSDSVRLNRQQNAEPDAPCRAHPGDCRRQPGRCLPFYRKLCRRPRHHPVYHHGHAGGMGQLSGHQGSAEISLRQPASR